MMKHSAVALIALGALLPLAAQEAPIGSPSKITRPEQKSLDALAGTVKGRIVWSTSRANSKHDIWIMNADGSDQKALTKSEKVDWFPRWSPDGKKVLFTRSKMGWVAETDAKFHEKWELWTINGDGSDEKKIIDNACWGSWSDDGKSVIFSRDTKAYRRDLASGEEVLLLDGDTELKAGTVVQQPQLSPNGKYLAATLRGTMRETGIWHLEKKSWATTGNGCQINWFPTNDEIYRMNPTGNGGTAAPSEVLAMKVADGVPVENVNSIGKFRLMDLPGRRSHEYFPKFDKSGSWMVWCATEEGHDHDLFDYEVYIWKRGEPVAKATRLTFHSGNDRWPDIYID
jgi:hypothetical protein